MITCLKLSEHQQTRASDWLNFIHCSANAISTEYQHSDWLECWLTMALASQNPGMLYLLLLLVFLFFLRDTWQNNKRNSTDLMILLRVSPSVFGFSFRAYAKWRSPMVLVRIQLYSDPMLHVHIFCDVALTEGVYNDSLFWSCLIMKHNNLPQNYTKMPSSFSSISWFYYLPG